MEAAAGFVADYASPFNDYVLTFDDDGRVAYAYLKRDGRIVGDVWIYNRREAPERPEWSDRSKAPFANPAAHTLAEGRPTAPVGPDDVRVEWGREDGRQTAYIQLCGDLVAVVGEGDKPGRCKFAAKDGPLARRLVVRGRAGVRDS